MRRLIKNKTQSRKIRHKRVRAKIFGTGSCPRLAVFRSVKHIVLQLVDDTNGRSLVQVTDKGGEFKKGATKTEIAKVVGSKLAVAAKGKKISKVVFDRGGYLYHGRVKAAAEGAREGGLKF